MILLAKIMTNDFIYMSKTDFVCLYHEQKKKVHPAVVQTEAVRAAER